MLNSNYALVIFFLISSAISSLSCSKELSSLKVKSNKEQSIKNFDYTYDTILRRTKEVVGKANIKLEATKRQDIIFYKIYQYAKIRKTKHTSNIVMESTSTTDSNFKLKLFEGSIIEDNKVSKRKGYYKPPYYYIEEDDKRSKIKSSKPLYSSIVEHYLIRNMLKKPGDAINYHFLNIISLIAEEEEISFTGEITLDNQKKVKEYKIKNYTNDYTHTYLVDEEHRLIEKTDFNNLLIWKLQ